MTNFQTEEWSKIFRNLLADIKNEKCVLLIGPEIVKVDGIPLNLFLRDKLIESNAADIVHYYKRDGLFLFRDQAAKQEVQQEINFFYEEHPIGDIIDETTYKHIAEMPFHLVVSINPDCYLSDVCNQYGIKHQFSHFQTNGGAVAEVEEPTKNNPLLYNLCGNYRSDQSLILDYDDLFRLMKTIFGAPGLPTKLKSSLVSAKTFICLGFDFDKWYSQLLLNLLSEKDEVGSVKYVIKKYAINTEIADTSTNAFLVQQFGITFLGEEQDFFKELYRRCSDEQMLRATSNPVSLNIAHIIQQIRDGEIRNALRSLERFESDDRAKSDLILLSAQFNHLESERNKGLLNLNDYAVRFNQIVNALLDTLKYAH
jgi:hypothetical protein